jgi:tRNA(Arg) A34 adenosine deaminase TadA
MLALSLAQRALGDWNLGARQAVQLVTSCEPCAMCFGAIPWSGVSSLLWGARKEDAEAAGFDEGDKPADWAATLEARGIRTRGGVLRDEAAAVLRHYASGNGAIYHPAS